MGKCEGIRKMECPNQKDRNYTDMNNKITCEFVKLL